MECELFNFFRQMTCVVQLLDVKIVREAPNRGAGVPEITIGCNVHASDDAYCNTSLHWALTPIFKFNILQGYDTIPYAELVKALVGAGADPFLENGARKDKPSSLSAYNTGLQNVFYWLSYSDLRATLLLL